MKEEGVGKEEVGVWDKEGVGSGVTWGIGMKEEVVGMKEVGVWEE